MAQQSHPQYEFQYQKVQLLKTESLGIGSYGAVYKAMCDDLPCAAKILHPTLFQFTAPGNTSAMRNFERECRLLSAIKHPHIVQYLGTYHDPESKLPVLLMELMDESLTRFLEWSHEPLPFHTEMNLCHDIALALSYLHSNGIVHRDLSSNNVLLIAGSRAKVTDFGMVKLYDVNHSTAHLTPLTQCPGTVAYMSPEALGEPPVYTDKLDSFSLGVLCVQIMTRQFPDPGDRFKIIEINDPRAPSGTVKVDVSEIERRQSHIDLIDPAHPLLPVALDCLKDRDRERPSCHELCGRMSTLKASPEYIEQSQAPPIQEQLDALQRRLAGKDHQLHTLRDQLQEKEQENRQQQQQILELQTLLSSKDEQLQTLQQQPTGKEDQLDEKETTTATLQEEIEKLREQLQSSEQAIAAFQKNLLDREKTIRDQQREIQELKQQLKLRWRDGGRAPCRMHGEVATVYENMAYIQPEGSSSVFGYNSTNNKWSELPECPNSGFSLAMVNSLLTAIGGKMPNSKVTNSLLSLTDSKRKRMKWTERFVPMPTKRWLTAAVCGGKSLVVAGGSTENMKLSTVEVMDTETLQWSTASSLPHQLCQATVTLCGDQVYMLGGRDLSGKQSKSVFTCSLAALLKSCQSRSPGVQLMTMSLTRKPEVWHQLADTPVTLSTCASLHGRLLAVGGCNSDNRETTAVHMYNTTTNSWKVISHMATPRTQCLVAVLPHNELMVVGGHTPGGLTDSVEVATII